MIRRTDDPPHGRFGTLAHGSTFIRLSANFWLSNRVARADCSFRVSQQRAGAFPGRAAYVQE